MVVFSESASRELHTWSVTMLLFSFVLFAGAGTVLQGEEQKGDSVQTNTASDSIEISPQVPLELPGLIAFWDFQEPAGEERVSQGGQQTYALEEQRGPIQRVEGGVFGPYSAKIKRGQWLMIERDKVGELDVYGPEGEVTVVAWVRRLDKPYWQAIAGIWDETHKKRQYCLFLNAPQGPKADEMVRYPLSNRIHGHVSNIGGPTPGHKYCITYSSGATEIPMKEWVCLAMSYDGEYSRVFVNGKLDSKEQYNPFPYPGGLYHGGAEGGPFTVGGVHRGNEWGNFFGGQMGGLAVYRRALSEEELQKLAGPLAKSSIRRNF